MCWCAGVISEQQSRAAQSPSSEPGSVSEWATASRSQGSQGNTVDPWVLLLLSPSCSPFLSPISVTVSHTLSLYSHSIKFKQRHAGLFIGEWCFFIRLCLFVALRSTEGFLAPDVSSAALQRNGGGMCKRETERETEGEGKTDKNESRWQKERQKENRQSWRMHDIWQFVEYLHEASLGKWEGLFPSERCNCKMSACTVCVPVPLFSSLSLSLSLI